MRAALVSTLAGLTLAAAGCGSDVTYDPPPPPPPCLPFGDACAQAAACCSQVCIGGTCLCNPVPGSKCGLSTDCCPGMACTSGVCVQGCRPNGDACANGFDCCSDACDATGHCAATCSSGACAATAECCIDRYCALGFCSYGACGDLGDLCDDTSDCCQSPKHLTCSGSTCRCGLFASACATDADCCNLLVCSGGLCHPSPGTADDGQPCLANADCQSGTCAGAALPAPGVCCTTGGGSCAAGSYGSLCCSPLTCHDGAATGTFACGACLDWTNSGAPAPGVAACTLESQCCSGQSLTCESATGRCAKMYGVACSTEAECLTGADCSTRPGSSGNVCCSGFGSPCLAYGCCSGLECTQDQGGTGTYTCHVAPGGACQADLDCARGDSCLAGTCCSHSGSCSSGAECCSGVCDGFFCDYAPPYGQCQANGDCLSGAMGYPNVCGGNLVVGPNLCCPAPGDACAQGADCCEAGDLCQVELTAPPGDPARCCRANQATCARDPECCSGVCGGAVDDCCSPAKYDCAVAADCCGKGAFPAAQDCQAGKCCLVPGVNAYGDETACCSGRADQNGLCRP